MYDSQLCNKNLYNGLLLNYVAVVFNYIFPLYFNYGTAVHQKYVYSIYEIYFWFSRDFYVIFYLIQTDDYHIQTVHIVWSTIKYKKANAIDTLN